MTPQRHKSGTRLFNESTSIQKVWGQKGRVDFMKGSGFAIGTLVDLGRPSFSCNGGSKGSYAWGI